MYYKEMSRCYALTGNHKPCRNYGVVLEKDSEQVLYAPTCRHHTHYFDSWSERLHRFGKGLEWSQPYYNHVKRVLEEGIVEIKKEHIEGLPEQRNYTHFILLCAKYVIGFKRSWNPVAFDRSLRNIWWQIFAVGPIYVSSQDLVLLMKCYDEPLVKSFYTVFTKFPDTGYQEPHEEDWFRVIEVVLENTYLKWEPDLLLPEHFQTLKEKTTRFPRLQKLVQDGRFEEKLRSAKESFYKHQKESIESVKEELMAVCWHPDRYMDWCMDWEEKEWLTSQW